MMVIPELRSDSSCVLDGIDRLCLSLIGRGLGDARKFPAVGREEEMDYMVVEVGLRLEIRVDHFPYRCRAIGKLDEFGGVSCIVETMC